MKAAALTTENPGILVISRLVRHADDLSGRSQTHHQVGYGVSVTEVATLKRRGKIMKARGKGKFAGVALALSALAVGAAAPAAQAASDPTNVTVSSSNLTLGAIAIGDFPGVTLNGTVRSTTATMTAFDVNDSRGTGAGWNVTIGATEFKEWDSTLNTGAGGYVVSGKTIGTSRTSMATATVAKADATSSTAPTMTAGAYTLDAGTAVKIASAAADGTGMGSYTITPGGTNGVTLTVDAKTYAKAYRSDVTVTLATGP